MQSTNSIIPSYSRQAISFVRGEGPYLFDESGSDYLDALCGISVTNLGHSHPELVKCLKEQSEKLWHTSNLYRIESQEKLANKLCEVSNMSQAFFCNSGAEANETAIKISRLFAEQKNIIKPQIITFNNSFHGRTMATLSATGNSKIHQGFSPLVSEFLYTDYNNIKKVKQLLNNNSNIVAILIEPVQGEGGINVAEINFLKEIEQLCKKHDLLFMLDEIQSGMARTGYWYAHQSYSIECDVMTTAKALGNGFPIGACLINHKAMNLIQPGKHGTTFGGNPLACSVALQVINIIEQESILDNVQKTTLIFKDKLEKLIQLNPTLIKLKQAGLMIGLEMDSELIDCTKVVETALTNKLLINVTAGNIIRLLPPLNLNKSQITLIVDRLQKTLSQLST